VATSAALFSTPAAFGAVSGDPIASNTFTVKVSQGFKGQLKSNGVKMKPAKLTLRSGDVDPTTGAADLKLNKKITFKLTGKGIQKCTRKADSKKKAKQCKKGVAYSNLKGSLPGNVKGSSGKLFSFGAATVARNGFGADLSGIKVKFLKSAAKKINKKLGLNSLHPSAFGTASLSYQPQTVAVTGGEVVVRVPLAFAPFGPEAGTSVTGKLPSHCVDPFVGGVLAIPPGVLEAFSRSDHSRQPQVPGDWGNREPGRKRRSDPDGRWRQDIDRQDRCDRAAELPRRVGWAKFAFDPGVHKSRPEPCP